ncbi:hypothetical protein NDU88_004096 [Pleurodeles waltl]|uniref:Uncharacterized protein n=1 Tax=Pleurodeles waltl TaxID=8319 RepID=A0AAV7RH39_PLEWA|nr:hypothetical protein NDU88_004096 [Pleurodeles waltl]
MAWSRDRVLVEAENCVPESKPESPSASWRTQEEEGKEREEGVPVTNFDARIPELLILFWYAIEEFFHSQKVALHPLNLKWAMSVQIDLDSTVGSDILVSMPSRWCPTTEISWKM